MTLPSLAFQWNNGAWITPRIHVIEVRAPAEPEAAPVAWMLIEREETYEYEDDGRTIRLATIELHYEKVRSKYDRRAPAKGSFRGSYHATAWNGPAISLTSHSNDHGAVFVDPGHLRGHRLGTYLMNEIVEWAMRWPDVLVNPIALLAGQAYGENKFRRNRFYEQFGLRFHYDDPEQSAGLSVPVPAGSLTPVTTWKQNLRVLSASDLLQDLLIERAEVKSDLHDCTMTIRSLLDERRHAERQPVCWAVKQLWTKYRQVVLLAAIMAVFVTVGWWRLRL